MGQVAASLSPTTQLIPAITVPPVSSHTYLHHTTLQSRPKLILIGDSITEQGSSHAQGWVANLAIRYNRRLDVINRGMNGYNSQWGLAALPLILEDILGPSVSIEEDEDGECAKEGDQQSNAECITTKSSSTDTEDIQQEYPQYTFVICFGANDSALSNGAHSRHHIPLQEYTSNLKQMINMIQAWNKSKKIAVALLTPPPCDTEVQKKSRDNNITRLYAEACKQLANEMRISVVDLWSGLQLPIKNSDEKVEESSFKSNQQWKVDYLSDGLHLTALGNFRLYELVIEMLDKSISKEEQDGNSGVGLSVTALPRSFPDHSMIDANNPQQTFTR